MRVLRALLAASTLTACRADSPVSPKGANPGLRPAPHFDVTSVNLPAPSSNAPPTYGVLQPIATGYRLLPGEWARIRITGSVLGAENSLCTTQQDWTEIPPTGLVGYGLNVATLPVDSSVTPVLQTPAPGGWSFTRDLAGGGWVTYQGGYYHDRSSYLWIGRSSAQAGECRLVNENVWIQNSLVFSGSQTATIEPVVYRVTPSGTEFVADQAIHFDLSVDGLSVTNIEWTYRPASGFPTVVTQCAGQITCDFAPSGAGFMEVSGEESVTGDVITTFTANLTMLPPCPPSGFSELDNNPAFRNGLNTLYFTAVGLGVEQAAYRLRNTATGRDSVVNATKRADDCHIWEMDTTKVSIPGYTRVGGDIHVHIVPAGAPTPASCGPTIAGTPMTNGPSWWDWDHMASTPGRDYVIDDDEVHIIDDRVPGSTVKIYPPIPWPAQCRVMLRVP